MFMFSQDEPKKEEEKIINAEKPTATVINKIQENGKPLYVLPGTSFLYEEID